MDTYRVKKQTIIMSSLYLIMINFKNIV